MRVFLVDGQDNKIKRVANVVRYYSEKNETQLSMTRVMIHRLQSETLIGHYNWWGRKKMKKLKKFWEYIAWVFVFLFFFKNLFLGIMVLIGLRSLEDDDE